MSGGKTTLALLCSDASAPPGRAQHTATTQCQGPVPWGAPGGAVQGGAGNIFKDMCLLSATEEHLGMLEG